MARSAEAIDTSEKLDGLWAKYRNILHDRKASGNAITLMDALFENPYIRIPMAQKRLNITCPTAEVTVTIMINAGMPVPTDIPHRSRIFVAA